MILIPVEIDEKTQIAGPKTPFPEKHFGILCDGTNYKVFETFEEAESNKIEHEIDPNTKPDVEVKLTQEEINKLKTIIQQTEVLQQTPNTK